MIYTTTRDLEIDRKVYVQGGRINYFFTLEYRCLNTLFPEDSRTYELGGEKIQRKLNKARVNKMAKYLLARHGSTGLVTIPPIIASIMEPRDPDNPGSDDFKTQGAWTIPKGSEIVIMDGQHRIEAIRSATYQARRMKRNEKKEANICVLGLDYEVFPICVTCVFKASEMQQIFADINANASKPNKSLSLYFDRENPFNASIVQVINRSELLRKYTDVEKNTVPGKSDMIFTTAGIHRAAKALLGHNGSGPLTPEEVSQCISAYEQLAAAGVWPAVTGAMTAAEQRETLLTPHAVFIAAMMRVLRSAINAADYPEVFKAWSRGDVAMDHRCEINGALKAGVANELLVSAKLKALLGIDLSPEEIRLERERTAYIQTIKEAAKRGAY